MDKHLMLHLRYRETLKLELEPAYYQSNRTYDWEKYLVDMKQRRRIIL